MSARRATMSCHGAGICWPGDRSRRQCRGAGCKPERGGTEQEQRGARMVSAATAGTAGPACCSGSFLAHACLLCKTLSCAGAVSWGFRTCWMPGSGGCKQAQLVCAVMRCKQDFWYNYSGGSRAKHVEYRTLSVIMQLHTCISISTI